MMGSLEVYSPCEAYMENPPATSVGKAILKFLLRDPNRPKSKRSKPSTLIPKSAPQTL